MKMLRKTITAIVIIALLKVIMMILDRVSPGSAVFHRQFLFSCQLLVIVWLLLSLLLFIFKVGRSWVARSLPILIVMAVLGADILFSYWMENPSKIPGFLKNEYKQYYSFFERNIIDYEPCSVYDTAYGYKFIPGLAFTFGNIEYKNNYVVNSESLRDEEGAMMGPQIICAGNSYTLGIGTEQKQTYPVILAASTGKTVLNTGNSSYGTVRELKRLVNADTSILQYAVIQYSKYDVYENASFIDSHDTLKIPTEAQYIHTKTNYRWRREYFPGKYAITITYSWLKSKLRGLRKKKHFLSGDAVESAGYFLKIIDRYKLGSNMKILVTEINDYNDMASGFLPAVDSLLQQPQFARLKNMVRTIDVSDVLTRADYYMIDSHLRPVGHQKVATKLADYIKSDSALQHSN